MTEVQEGRRLGRGIALGAAAAVLIGGTVFGAVQLSGGSGSTAPSGDVQATSDGGDKTMKPVKNQVLSEPMSGQEAIDALGDDIEVVASKNNMSVEKLEDLLLRDKSAHVTENGFIVYKDPGVK